jgi:hypothetical protein
MSLCFKAVFQRLDMGDNPADEREISFRKNGDPHD